MMTVTLADKLPEVSQPLK